MAKLYLDDVRPLPDDSYILVRSYDEAINYIKENGIPNFISFDHDLGVDSNENLLPSGYDFAKWLVEMDMENIYKFPFDFSFHVHSANPVGKQNIETYLNNYLIHKILNTYELEEKLYHYKNLYNDVEASITILLCETKDKELIEKYETIISNEMKSLEIYSEKNKERLKNLQKDLKIFN